MASDENGNSAKSMELTLCRVEESARSSPCDDSVLDKLPPTDKTQERYNGAARSSRPSSTGRIRRSPQRYGDDSTHVVKTRRKGGKTAAEGSKDNADADADATENSNIDAKKDEKRIECPHCHKSFSTKIGLTYHTEKKVCAQSKFRLFCPVCNKGFTNRYGYDYHVNNKVCESSKKSRQQVEGSNESNGAIEDDGDDASADIVENDIVIPSAATTDGDEVSTAQVCVENVVPTVIAANPRPRITSHSNSLTCQYCNKVFLSILGRTYHEQHLVCLQGQNQDQPNASKKRDRHDGDAVIEIDSRSEVKRKKQAVNEQVVEDTAGAVDESNDTSQQALSAKKRPLSSTSSKADKKNKRVRGSLADRTCPNCKKVFTSIHGCSYHVEKGVCGGGAKTNKPFPTLAPGERFDTIYGVCEVVRDDRAVPTANYPSGMKEKIRSYQSRRSKLEAHIEKKLFNARVASLANRFDLNSNYTNSKRDQNLRGSSIRRSQLKSKDVGEMKTQNIDYTGMIGADPSEPAESYPDRIVECILVSDKRSRVLGLDDGYTPLPKPVVETTTKLFLSRRMLKDAYVESSEVIVSHCCGRCFTSRPGFRYHVREKSCRSKPYIEAEKRRATLETAEKAVVGRDEVKSSPVVSRGKKPSLPIKSANVEQSKTVSMSEPDIVVKTENKVVSYNTFRQPINSKTPVSGPRSIPKKIRRRMYAIYPQCMISLGFKFVADGPQIKISAFDSTKGKLHIPIGLEQPQVKEETVSTPPTTVSRYAKGDQEYSLSYANKRYSKATEDEDWKKNSTDAIIQELTQRLQAERSKLIGPMYTEVWSSLCYEWPKKTSREKFRKVKKPRVPVAPPIDVYNEKAAKALSRKKLQLKELDIVDIRPLVAETIAGRFPSLKPDKDRDHGKYCQICNEGGSSLSYCLCCSNANHYDCMQTKIFVKPPEPDDDFLCLTCIRYIMTMRNRAEKRIMNKQETMDLLLPDRENGKDTMLLATSLVKGREYECAAAQVRRINDIMELMKDAQSRVRDLASVSSLNCMRDDLITQCEEELISDVPNDS